MIARRMERILSPAPVSFLRATRTTRHRTVSLGAPAPVLRSLALEHEHTVSMTRFRRLVRAHRILAAVAGLVILSAVVAGARCSSRGASSPAAPSMKRCPLHRFLRARNLPTGPQSQAHHRPRPPVPQHRLPPPARPPAAPLVLSSGAFQSQEHETTGTAQLVKLADGSHLVRLENLASSDGPDVKVWLSSWKPVATGSSTVQGDTWTWEHQSHSRQPQLRHPRRPTSPV